MIPSHYIFLDNFPLTVNGKIDRSRLPDPIIETRTGSHGHFSPIENEIANILSSLLNIEFFDTDSNFFEVCGNSILAIKLINL